MTVTVDGKYPGELARSDLDELGWDTVEKVSKIFQLYMVRERDHEGIPYVMPALYYDALKDLMHSFFRLKEALNDPRNTETK